MTLFFSFQSTCHIRGMTIGVVRLSPVYNISIHMPHTWHDGAGRVWSRCHRPFQSTCHIRGMTPDVQEAIDTVQISIHMPHTWHDGIARNSFHPRTISIHMPHTWHDASMPSSGIQPVKFQSTCHIRGMTKTSRI